MIEPPRSIAVYALTSAGADKARAIARSLPEAIVFLPGDLAEPEKGEDRFSRLAEILAHNFRQFNGHVVVAAAGIVVRSLARLIEDKATDPAVVVVDQEGRFAVSLLSGHLGGANRLAETVAGILGGQAVITTATDSAGKPSLEVIAAGRDLKTENLKALSRISRIILENGTIPVFDPDGWFWPGLTSWPEHFQRLDASPDLNQKAPLVWVGPEIRPFPDSWLLIRPPSLILGMGCNRHTDVEELAGLVDDVLKSHCLAAASIGGLASIAAKRDEAGLLALAERLNLEPVFFQSEELALVQTPTPSGVVEKHMGVKSVCEAAALLAARTDRLLITKQKSLNATLAVALTSST